MKPTRADRRIARRTAKGHAIKAAPDATVYRTPSGKRVTRGAGGKDWPDKIGRVAKSDLVLVMDVSDGWRGYIDPAHLTPE